MSRRKMDPLRELTAEERQELLQLSRSQTAPAVSGTRLDHGGSAARSSHGGNASLALAVILKAFPSVNIKLIGYADSSGTSEDQITRSTQMATTVKESLTERGIDLARIAVEGHAADGPAAPGAEEGRQQKPRVVLAVTKLG